MLNPSRTARRAGLALALATPMVMGSAVPAFAAGESATASLTAPTSGSATTFTWDYTFHQDGGHGLSNVAIAFCSADLLADVASAGPSADIVQSGDVVGGHAGFGPGIKFAVTATTGTLTVTFNHAHPISEHGLLIQSHSGDGQTGDSIETAQGPGTCSADVVTPDPDPTPNPDPVVDPTVIVDPAPNTPDPAPNPTPDPTPQSPTVTPAANPSPTTAVLGETLARPTTPAEPTVVLGATLPAGGELPRTGSDVQPLLALALGLVAGGSALRAVSSRRVRSVSSPD
jgi:hypothetical protein